MTHLSSEKPELFKGCHFNHLLIIQAVRWYVTYKLSYRDVCELMAERGVTVAHTTVLRWVQRFIPIFEKMWKKYARSVGSSWRVDETYIRVKGQWRYLYRAVDKQGQTVDLPLNKNRDQAAAVLFFKKAIGSHEAPKRITLDGSRASHQAVAELKAGGVLPAQTLVRNNKYLNNMIEQDHRKVKHGCYHKHVQTARRTLTKQHEERRLI
jgi:transposase-like protein